MNETQKRALVERIERERVFLEHAIKRLEILEKESKKEKDEIKLREDTIAELNKDEKEEKKSG